MTMRPRPARAGVLVLSLICAAVLSACSLGQEQAQQAIETVQAKYNEIKADAQAYLPEQAKLVEDAYTSVKNTIASGEYMKGLKEAQALTTKIGELRTVLEARKATLAKSWDSFQASVPTSFEELEHRVAVLEKSGKLPDGISREAVTAAKSAIPTVQAKWDEALAAAKSADWKVAIEHAENAKAKAVELMTSLGMPVPDNWKASGRDPH